MKMCLNCGKELTKEQSDNKFCCQSCFSEYREKQYISDWQNGDISGLVGSNQLSKVIRRYLLKKNNYKCELCGWGEQNPYTLTYPLEIHHIDGNYQNNKEDNLQVLCPNCHSLTKDYRGAKTRGTGRQTGYDGRAVKENTCIDCGMPISKGAIRCRSCANKHRVQDIGISRDELKQLIRTTPFTTIGKLYNVSDNAVRKWCDKYNLPRKTTEIKAYSDEEWVSI